MWYVYLFFILIFLAILYYYIFKKDVLSISFISCIIYALSTLAAFISYKIEGSWNYVELHQKTAIYVIISVICIGIGEFIVRKLTRKDKNNKREEIKLIKVSDLKILICIAFLVLTFFLIYMDMCRITNVTGISKVINAYKQSSAMYNDSDNVEQISFLFTQLYRISVAMGIIFLYIYVNNMCYNYKLKYNFRFIIPILSSIATSMLLGGRSAIMRFIVATFIFFIIIYRKKKQIQLFKFIRMGVLILVIVLPLFYMLLGAIGQSTQNNFVDYMTFYLGSPIPGFDEYLQKYSEYKKGVSQNFGENTFIGIQQILHKFHIIDYYNVYQSEWIDFGNGLKSNVFTGIKTYFQDFGINGILIFQTLFGIIFTYLYVKAKNSNYKYLIFYGLISITLIDQFRSEKIFHALIRIDTLVYIFSIILITWFLFNFKFERKYNNE